MLRRGEGEIDVGKEGGMDGVRGSTGGKKGQEGC